MVYRTQQFGRIFQGGAVSVVEEIVSGEMAKPLASVGPGQRQPVFHEPMRDDKINIVEATGTGLEVHF